MPIHYLESSLCVPVKSLVGTSTSIWFQRMVIMCNISHPMLSQTILTLLLSLRSQLR